MSADMQVKMWLSIRSEENAYLLKKHGFDPNIEDSQGNTALKCIENDGHLNRELALSEMFLKDVLIELDKEQDQD